VAGRGTTVVEVTSETPLPTLPLVDVVGRKDRERAGLVANARWVTRLSLGWHGVEAGVAIAGGVMAGSVALVGFGADSFIEAAAGLVILWLVSGDRLSSHHAERRAQQLIAVSFLLLAAYVTVESARDLIAGHHPQASWLGVGLAAVTLVAMPPLAAAKPAWDGRSVPRRP
jgi:divalent metal cation (Fe/Co/Zn/Cd) transporter